MDERLEEAFLLAYLDTMGYARRRTGQDPKKLFPIIVERYVQAITNFAKVKEKLNLTLGAADIRLGDSRQMDLSSDSIDGIVVSPPYSFAIDYIDNDRPQLEYLGVEVRDLKNKMIGLIGESREQRVKRYFEDMRKVIQEFYRVLKKDRYCVIVIGSNEIQTGGIRHELEFEKYAKETGFRLFRKIPRPITGIGNVMRDEYLLFFIKE
jgi:tRNA G10  N-methylase Trm11